MVYILIQKSFGGMESELMVTQSEKFSLLEKFSQEEDGTHNAESSRTASPTHHQRAIPAAPGTANSVHNFVPVQTFDNETSVFAVCSPYTVSVPLSHIKPGPSQLRNKDYITTQQFGQGFFKVPLVIKRSSLRH